jgi:hypothetical protein
VEEGEAEGVTRLEAVDERVVDHHDRHADHDLDGERHPVRAEVAGGDRAGGEDPDGHDRADGVPGVADEVEPAVGMHAAAGDLGDALDQVGGRAEDRDERQRGQQQERDERELVDAGLARAHLEADPAGERKQPHEAGDQEQVDLAVGGDGERDGGGREGERHRDPARDHALTRGHWLLLAFPRLPDKLRYVHAWTFLGAPARRR